MKFAKDVFLFPKSIICDERRRIIEKQKPEDLIDDYLLNRLSEDEKEKEVQEFRNVIEEIITSVSRGRMTAPPSLEAYKADKRQKGGEKIWQ